MPPSVGNPAETLVPVAEAAVRCAPGEDQDETGRAGTSSPLLPGGLLPGCLLNAHAIEDVSNSDGITAGQLCIIANSSSVALTVQIGISLAAFRNQKLDSVCLHTMQFLGRISLIFRDIGQPTIFPRGYHE